MFEKLREFIYLFGALQEAAYNITGDFKDEPEIDEINSCCHCYYCSEIEGIISPYSSKDILTKLLDEIDINLYKYPQSRVEYVRNIVRLFIDIVPYLVLEPNFEETFESIKNVVEFNGKNCNNPIKTALSVIKNNPDFNENIRPCVQKSCDNKFYILYCKRVLLHFSTQLDAKCLNLRPQIDLMQIQKDLNIFLFHERNKKELIKLGYENDLKLLYDNYRSNLDDSVPSSDPQPEVNIFCKEMPLSIPREHFIYFVEKNSKNGEPFLEKEQFELFINRAFCGKQLPKQQFNIANKEDLIIKYRFYEFYGANATKYFDTNHCQDEFIKLLTDNFEGWDFKKVKNNFSKKPLKRP